MRNKEGKGEKREGKRKEWLIKMERKNKNMTGKCGRK